MLEGLDDIAWGALTHAYGEAEDTPQLLRQAASADVEQARAAARRVHKPPPPGVKMKPGGGG